MMCGSTDTEVVGCGCLAFLPALLFAWLFTKLTEGEKGGK